MFSHCVFKRYRHLCFKCVILLAIELIKKHIYAYQKLSFNILIPICSCNQFDFCYYEFYGFKNILRRGPQALPDSQGDQGPTKSLGGRLRYGQAMTWKMPEFHGQEPAYYINIHPGQLCEQKINFCCMNFGIYCYQSVSYLMQRH